MTVDPSAPYITSEAGARRRRGPTAFWPLQIGAWLAFGVAMAAGRVGELPALAIVAIDLPFAALGFLTTLLLHRTFLALHVGEDTTFRSIALVLVLSYLAGLLWTALFHSYLHGVAVPSITGWYPGIVLPIRRAPVLDNTVYNTLVLVAWSTLYLGLLYRDMLQVQRADALRAAAELRDAQLRMLAYQLNPHFLFNTLNSIRALIDEDGSRARDMVTELARFLRYSLIDRPLHLAPLAEEVAALEGYLAIEGIRFEERLDVRVEVAPDAARCPVPAFLLQPLVENALKHGLPPAPGAPLTVRVHAYVTAAERLCIRVENSGAWGPGTGTDAGPGRTHTPDDAQGDYVGGIGLRNVRARLAHHYPGAHRLIVDERTDRVRVTVELPAMSAMSAMSAVSTVSAPAIPDAPDAGRTLPESVQA